MPLTDLKFLKETLKENVIFFLLINKIMVELNKRIELNKKLRFLEIEHI